LIVEGRRAACEALPCGYVEAQVQPAGVDLRLASVEVFKAPGVLGVESRVLPEGEEVEPGPDGFYTLPPGAYRVRFADTVRIPLWAVGFCYPRSSLLRMGVSLHCAVWDPGYEGRGQALLTVYNPEGFRVERGARIAQLVLARLDWEPASGYRGAYQGEAIGRRSCR